MPTINWDDIYEEGQFDDSPAPAGSYLCEVEKAEWKTNSKNNPMLQVRYRITAGPQKGKALFDYISITRGSERALAISLRNLATLGLTKEVLKSTSDEEQENLVVGQTFQVETTLENYQGEPRSRIKRVARPQGSVVPSAPSPTGNVPPPRPFGN